MTTPATQPQGGRTAPTDEINAIEVRNLVRRFGSTDAVNGLSFTVRPGRCFGLFGRNGAGKTTTIKCLLNHLRPTSGTVRVFGAAPLRDEVAVKAHIGYVPEVVAFYPWMTVRATLDYAASFRLRWNRDLELDLLRRFDLDASKRVDTMSKGMRAQLGLLCAVCPEPDLLLLDEPTSGLDPIVRREFLQTVIGAYQDGAPERRTVLVSTHLISEWEGLIDEFTVIDHGRELVTLGSDEARERFRKLRVTFAGDPPALDDPAIISVAREGRDLVVTTGGPSEALVERLRALAPEAVAVENLSLEEIFIASARIGREELR